MRPSHWADRLVTISVRFIGLLIVLAALGSATASFLYNKAREDEQANRIAAQVNMRLRDHVAILEAVRALYQSDAGSSGAGIRAYLAALQPQIYAPGMEGVGIATAMRRGDSAAAAAMLRQNYGRNIAIWPASDQPIGFPIVLVEPDNPRRHNALGYDMYSDPTRREAMRRAWQTGRPATSGIVQLVQERDVRRKQPGFLIYVPVYARSSGNGAAATIAADPLPFDVRDVATAPPPIEAFVYAPFRTRDLMLAVLGSNLDTVAGIEVFAGEGPAAPLVFRQGKVGWDAHDQRLRVGDRRWTLRISYGRFIDRLGRPIAILIFGVALAVLATKLHRVQQRRIAAAQALADEKARHAEDRELMMGEMAHRMKNAFARIGALARITLREVDSLEGFEVKFDGRLRALSDAKQMLATGAVDTVDLGRIVRRELALAGWGDDRLAGIVGPDVRLDDDGAQAIALAVHELVTNSIKYGALGGSGALAVGWRRDGEDIELSWIESDLAETPIIDSESFGTQFIRSLIERQLKGGWTRTAADHGLFISIRWPDRVPA